MTDTDTTADYEFVDNTIVDIVESKELSRRLKNRIYRTIEEHEGVTLDQAGEIAQAVEACYLDTRVDPLDPVGTISAQSIGESGTQMTMSTFHYVDVTEIDVTQGLPRLIELADTRGTPDTLMMTMYFEDECANNRELAHQVVWNVESTKILALGNISTNVADIVVQVSLNDETLLERWPTYDDRGIIASEITEAIGDTLDIKTRREGTLIGFSSESPSYRRLLQLVEELRDIVLKGIEEVFRAVIRKENNEDTDEKESVPYTGGSAFGDALVIEDVDISRTTSNNIREVYRQLSIEVTHEAIINGTVNTPCEQGLDDANIRHLILVADIMTNNGTIESIDRHDISGSEDSVLARAAFKVTVNYLLDATVHDEEDGLDGVIENVIVSKPIAIDTGDVNLRMDSLDVEDADANTAPEPSGDWQ